MRRSIREQLRTLSSHQWLVVGYLTLRLFEQFAIIRGSERWAEIEEGTEALGEKVNRAHRDPRACQPITLGINTLLKQQRTWN